jgi:transposase
VDWKERKHAQDWLIFPQNMGPRLSIDEVSLSQGELYTFVTNKDGKGKEGTLVACIKGTKSSVICKHVDKIPALLRDQVQEVTLDMAKNMESAIRGSFPQAQLVTDRFHVMALAYKDLQLLRTKLWRVCLEQENKEMEQAKKKRKPYKPKEYSNGDSPKQLLARSRFALFKPASNWTGNQSIRMKLLFEHYPSLKCAWQHVQDLAQIYTLDNRNQAYQQFHKWIDHCRHPEKHYWNKAEFDTLKAFKPTANSIYYHLDSILNFFNNRSTNASAESFNAKIKLFRAKLKGVRDIPFFLFRLTKLFA